MVDVRSVSLHPLPRRLYRNEFGSFYLGNAAEQPIPATVKQALQSYLLGAVHSTSANGDFAELIEAAESLLP